MLRQAIRSCRGEEVKTTGDGLMVVFRAAASAVSCAVQIQQGMEWRNRGADEPMAIRVGLALGDASFDDGDYFGTPVVEAVRLCGQAAGGQILATELVRVVGGRDGHEFQPLGKVALRGLPEPILAYEVAWEPAAGESERPALPTRLVASAERYVERVEEHERVLTRWRASIEGARLAGRDQRCATIRTASLRAPRGRRAPGQGTLHDGAAQWAPAGGDRGSQATPATTMPAIASLSAGPSNSHGPAAQQRTNGHVPPGAAS